MMIEVEVEVVDDFVNLFISNEKVHENIISGIYQFIDKGTRRSNVPQFRRNVGEAPLSTVKRHICGNCITGIMLSSFKRRELFYFSL
ncbi:hypothetical protein [Paenibacillus sp. Soil724D2]|uniref:hypothetical protein n=1 Tax=Paenibacillus sp. (strain Soil724D2) TaxID=1736392 RepID=UPI000713F2AD|nr:hypothetical protein [Paenibacillus sp. Soil724D2]KRE32885.1 hypothetical protein ASG85_15340 [Paenibacillus sp. Soil724D2]